MTLPSTSPLIAAIRSRVLAIPSWVLIIEIFIGAGWLRAGTEKLISAPWWRGETLATFVVETETTRVPWFQLVVDTVVVPNLSVVAALVAATQLGVGAALVSGRGRLPALLVGMAMNVSFVLAGAVTPSAFYLLAQLAVILWLVEQHETKAAASAGTVVALGGLALAGSALLSISTLHPAEVVEDPALMLVFLGLLAAVGAERAASVRRGEDVESPQPPVSVKG